MILLLAGFLAFPALCALAIVAWYFVDTRRRPIYFPRKWPV